MRLNKLAQSLLVALIPVGILSAKEINIDTMPVLVSYLQGELPSEFTNQVVPISSHSIRSYGSLNVTTDELELLLIESFKKGTSLKVEANYNYQFPNLLSQTHSNNELSATPWQLLIGAKSLVANIEQTTKVCLIDSGVQLDHPQLNPHIFSGLSSEYAGFWYEDAIGHGTHLAGILADPVFGDGSVIIEVRKVLKSAHGENSNIHNSDLISAIEQCANSGAEVINMSLSSPYFSKATRDVIDRLTYDKGVIFVAAAGNHGNAQSNKRDYLAFPAAYRNVVSVGAIDKNTNLAQFSAKNSSVDIVAPGVNIQSTINQNRQQILAVSDNAGSNLDYVQVDSGLQDYPNNFSVGANCLVSLPDLLVYQQITQSTLSSEHKQWINDKTAQCNSAQGQGIIFTYHVGFEGVKIEKLDVDTNFPTLLIPNINLDSINEHQIVELNIEAKKAPLAMLSGTSQAAAIVSAGIARLKSINPNVSRDALIAALYRSANDLGEPGRDSFFGYGLVDFQLANQILTGEVVLENDSVNNCPTSWYSNRAYQQGEQVAYGRFVYEASYWSKDEIPLLADNDNEAWRYIGECKQANRPYTGDFDADSFISDYQLTEMERIGVVYDCASYSLACGGGGGGFSGFIGWGYGGGSSFSGGSGGGGGGGSSPTPKDKQQTKEEKQFAEDAADITNAVVQFKTQLKQILNNLDKNSPAYEKVNKMLGNLGKLTDRLNSGLQGFNHAWNGEGQKALAEGLAFVVASATGKSVDFVLKQSAKNPILAVGKAAASVYLGMKAGSSAEAAFEKFIFDTYLNDFITAGEYYHQTGNQINIILNEMRCGYQKITLSRPDVLCSGDIRSTLELSGRYIVTLDLNNNGIQWQEAQAKNYLTLGMHDGILFVDRNHSGALDSSQEFYFTKLGTQVDTLTLLDGNGDHVINGQDNYYDLLKVWTDINSNGQVESNEIVHAKKLGLSIQLALPPLRFSATVNNALIGIEKHIQ
ncbi:S8 family peptidase [Pseudoalteromonas aliena]|uniref:Serine protease n=1 Tax=Pseudoalteromonas aliena SW19 TaxID=1314866 RepID=A0ABR9DY74_9GAMM|nr:S8 family serine peptidase [Pseudoalteromonas aliena]MBE0358615.1 serine protease [Pseudoalteromonas aliena SW19]